MVDTIVITASCVIAALILLLINVFLMSGCQYTQYVCTEPPMPNPGNYTSICYKKTIHIENCKYEPYIITCTVLSSIVGTISLITMIYMCTCGLRRYEYYNLD